MSSVQDSSTTVLEPPTQMSRGAWAQQDSSGGITLETFTGIDRCTVPESTRDHEVRRDLFDARLDLPTAPHNRV